MRATFITKSITLILILALLVGMNYASHNSLISLAYRLAILPGRGLQFIFIKIGDYSYNIRHLGSLSKEDAHLRAENERLFAQLANLEALQRENAILRNQLKLTTRNSPHLLLAKIFDREITPLSSAILIDKGSTDGLTKGLAITLGGNILLGIVDQVYDHSARVLLLDDPRSNISVRIQGTNTLGALKGALRIQPHTAVIDLITSKDPIDKDNMIITSGLDHLPPSLIIGEVSDITLTGGNLFKSVTAQLMAYPLIDPQVFVVLPQ